MIIPTTNLLLPIYTSTKSGPVKRRLAGLLAVTGMWYTINQLSTVGVNYFFLTQNDNNTERVAVLLLLWFISCWPLLTPTQA